MPRAFAREFRDDVVKVAQRREPGLTIKGIADDFWISKTCLQTGCVRLNWRPIAGPACPHLSRRNCVNCAGAMGCWIRRTRSCDGQPPTCRRRTFREKVYPFVSELAADGIPVAVTSRVLKLAGQPNYRWLAHPVPESELVQACRENAFSMRRGMDPESCYRFLAEEAADAGQVVAERMAWRNCLTNGWFSTFGWKPK